MASAAASSYPSFPCAALDAPAQHPGRKRRPVHPSYVAQIAKLATDQSRTDQSGKERVTEDVWRRLCSILARTEQGKGNSLQEMNAAARLLSRETLRYNIEDRDVVAWRDGTDKPIVSGSSTVCIVPSEGSKAKTVSFETWVSHLIKAMRTIFDCGVYTTVASDRSRLTLTFYGIPVNTAIAARMTEMAYNRTQQWAMDRNGNQNDKNSYRLGIGSGLLQTALDEKSLEMREARAEEQRRLTEQADVADPAAQRQQSAPPVVGASQQATVSPMPNIPSFDATAGGPSIKVEDDAGSHSLSDSALGPEMGGHTIPFPLKVENVPEDDTPLGPEISAHTRDFSVKVENVPEDDRPLEQGMRDHSPFTALGGGPSSSGAHSESDADEWNGFSDSDDGGVFHDSGYNGLGLYDSDDDGGGFRGTDETPLFKEEDEDMIDGSADPEDAIRQQMNARHRHGSHEDDPINLDDETNDDDEAARHGLSPSKSAGAAQDTPPQENASAATDISPAINADSGTLPPDQSQALVVRATPAQLQQYRDMSKKAAEDYLKQANVKTKKGRKRKTRARDSSAFADGKRDSKRLRERFENAPEDLGHGRY